MPEPGLNRTDSLLLVIDVQSRLVPAIHQGSGVVSSCEWLLRVAREMAVPVLVTEQSPDAIGETVPLIRDQSVAEEIFVKTSFSCVREPNFIERLDAHSKKQIVICGMEAHVCVMQTVLDLIAKEFEVFIVVDAIGARDPNDRQTALDRMTKAGAVGITREMLFFEWLRVAKPDSFSPLLRQFITGEDGLDSIKKLN